jgi:hypothetical protein
LTLAFFAILLVVSAPKASLAALAATATITAFILKGSKQ